MRIAYGADDAAGSVDALAEHLEMLGHAIEWVPAVGESSAAATPWVTVGHRVGRSVASGVCELGIVWCWTGTGVSIAANKVPGVRAALCGDAVTAEGSRRWNDANVLALSIRTTSENLAREIAEAFLNASADADTAAEIVGLESAAPEAGAAQPPVT